MARMVLLVFALALLGTACAPFKKSPISVGAAPIIKEYEIQARQFEVSPNEIRVPAGTRIRLVVTSADVDHQLVVLGIYADKETIQGRRQTLELVAWPPGTYEMTCGKVCGIGHDRMKATLVIE
ncbi:MAG: cupredoxin domain-containing protein [Dehalococcoidia bacterium]|nr:cupredoxin domain-containing protein [Dehalococcoidia bacterium]